MTEANKKRPHRFWTKKEEDLLRRCYSNNQDVVEALAKRTGRTQKAIQLRAYAHGLTTDQGRAPNAEPHEWSQEEIDILRREYQGTSASKEEIAKALGLTPAQIHYQVQRLGLAKTNDRRRWTKEEDERLKDLMGRTSPTKIAKLMNRTVNSIVVRSKRLNISRRDREGWYTKMEVCQILGKDHRWVQTRIDCGTLKAAYHMGKEPQGPGGAMWHINEKDLKDFITRYCHELNGRNVDLIQIVQILVGLPTMRY